MKTEVDQSTNTFPRKLNGTLEDIDIYIDCQNNNRIFSYGHGILQAYVPSLIRGHNIIKTISEQFGDEIIFDIEETDSEVLFKFNAKYDNKIIPLLKPRTNGLNISPFSSKNLPKNKKYKIPDEDLVSYKNIVANIPQKRLVTLTHSCNNFIKSLATKNNPIEKIKADMALKGLKPKEYIHSMGYWDKYIKYLSKELKEYL